MPRTALPPTPASSTDIAGQDGTKQLSQLQMAFELPPPAIKSRHTSSDTDKMDTPASPESPVSPKTPFRIQPSEAVKSRRRPSTAAVASKDGNFALPPPPTRSRKIIQMKPRPQEDKKPTEPLAAGKGSSSTAGAKRTATAPAASEAGPAKKKQPSASSAAGRKIARKTAHSLIERRRRSKMNEEFAVLKDMIPACTGEMHKLAILQASIEYVRYLQDCVEKLKSQRELPGQTTPEMDRVPTPSGREPYDPDHEYRRAYPEEQHSPDVEMTGSDDAPSPTFTTRPSSATTSASPALAAQDHSTAARHDSYVPLAAAAVEHHRHYSYSSATTSPAFGPQAGGYGAAGYAPSNHSAAGLALTSPALGPLRERDLDQEAMAALLMLNSDRRGTVSSTSGGSNAAGASGGGGGGSGRGMSVRDLLSA
ncbi:hypothetical protein Daus18300_002007 [Diaporthe australafricana]|uniref:BHLH domain-containing protein n=1 Tax=Diaporthe australafricana TaxID=127596 RepID=A0ABR3XRV7_9PEZI